MKGKHRFMQAGTLSTLSTSLFFVLSLTLIVIALAVVSGSALGNDGYAINWWTVDGGGGRLTGGDYALEGTVGQSSATRSENAPFTVASGYWGHISTIDGQDADVLYLPVVLDSQ